MKGNVSIDSKKLTNLSYLYKKNIQQNDAKYGCIVWALFIRNCYNENFCPWKYMHRISVIWNQWIECIAHSSVFSPKANLRKKKSETFKGFRNKILFMEKKWKTSTFGIENIPERRQQKGVTWNADDMKIHEIHLFYVLASLFVFPRFLFISLHKLLLRCYAIFILYLIIHEFESLVLLHFCFLCSFYLSSAQCDYSNH